jgi:hypothetical protein
MVRLTPGHCHWNCFTIRSVTALLIKKVPAPINGGTVPGKFKGTAEALIDPINDTETFYAALLTSKEA